MATSNETASQTPMFRNQEVLETDNFIETYQIIGEWIRFADAKAAVTLTVNGVILGLLVPTLKTYLADTAPRLTTWWTPMIIGLFVGWLVLMAFSAVSSFLCILPIRGTGRRVVLEQASHFHPAAVASTYPLNDLQKFVGDCDKMGTAGLKREVMAAILVDSHLSNSKYCCVTRAIWCLGWSVLFGFLYLMAIQF